MKALAKPDPPPAVSQDAIHQAAHLHGAPPAIGVLVPRPSSGIEAPGGWRLATTVLDAALCAAVGEWAAETFSSSSAAPHHFVNRLWRESAPLPLDASHPLLV
eukprot:1422957-Prymnesium_polylepis.1